jgi:hypothetical protein
MDLMSVKIHSASTYWFDDNNVKNLLKQERNEIHYASAE